MGFVVSKVGTSFLQDLKDPHAAAVWDSRAGGVVLAFRKDLNDPHAAALWDSRADGGVFVNRDEARLLEIPLCDLCVLRDSVVGFWVVFLTTRDTKEDRQCETGQYRIAVASGESRGSSSCQHFETHPTLPRFGTDRKAYRAL